ncbi:DNA-binding protein, partial [Acinetobacter gerneri]|nr:DNA-binding protein [Acinetobacter gerneri]
QLEKAEDREAKANSRIDTLLTLIEMKPTQVHPTPTSAQSSPSQVESTLNVDNNKHDGLTTPDQKENKRIPVPDHIEPEPEKRGFWSRFFRPYD